MIVISFQNKKLKLQFNAYIENNLVDSYTETFGFRTVEFRGTQIYVNDKPFYCVGFGMHEDFDVSKSITIEVLQ